MTCKSCEHLNVPPNKNGVIIPQVKKPYKCVVNIPTPVFPASADVKWPPNRRSMWVGDGIGCPLYSPRVRDKA